MTTTINKEDKLYVIMTLALRQASKELGIVTGRPGEQLFISALEFAFGQYSNASEATLLDLLKSREIIIKQAPELFPEFV